MKYNIGDKVVIVACKIGNSWNPEGKMDKWLGQIMTIRSIEGHKYKMVEDNDETDCNFTPGWNWYEHMIEGLADIELNDTNEDVNLNEFLSSYVVRGAER